MKKVFFVQPMVDDLHSRELYEVVRLNPQNQQYQKTAYHHLSRQGAEAKAEELNREYNDL